MLVTPEKVSQYMESENAPVAVDALKTIQHMNVSLKEYCALRDHLLYSFVLEMGTDLCFSQHAG